MCQFPNQVGLVNIDETILNKSLEGLYAYWLFSHRLLHSALFLFLLQTYAIIL